MPIRVLIVDPHEIMRAGIKLACGDREDLEIVGEASSLVEARDTALETNPDVAIIDPAGDSGESESLQAIGRLHEEFPNLKILVFTTADGPDHAVRFVQAGASGYLIKAAGLDEVSVAIRSVHIGRVFISHSSPTMTKPAPHPTNHGVTNATPGPAIESQRVPGPPLSAREQEVLLMLADGMTNKQVAESLFLSVKTVETYRSRIMKKHGLRDRAELVQFARRTIAPVPQPA